MIKFSELLCLALFLSNAFCLDCTEETDGCSKDGIQDDQKAHYVCLQNADQTACILKPYCNYTQNEDTSSEFKCSDYPVETTGKTCFENEETSGQSLCVEEYPCEKVPIPAESGDTQITVNCQQYPVSDKTKVSCVEDTSNDAEFACKENPYICSTVPKSIQSSIKCSDYEVTINDKKTHECVKTEDSDSEEVKAYACKEQIFKCNDVPKIEGETTIQCSQFADTSKSDTHICVENKESQDKQCKEMKLCSKVESEDMTSATDCSTAFYYDKENYLCRKNKEGTLCEQVQLCEKGTSSETVSCSSFSTSDDDHGCINIGTTTECKQELYCLKVLKPKDNTNTITCSQYTLSIENENTHLCIQDPLSETNACKEEFKCEKGTGESNDECTKYCYRIKK